jgi:rhamnogalacturonyl hydrolase YesR
VSNKDMTRTGTRRRAQHGDAVVRAARCAGQQPGRSRGHAHLFEYAKTALFVQQVGFWYRDASFVGSGTYWVRGNGWAIMALAKVLAALLTGDQRRAEYLQVFRRMANALVPLQRPDGFWNVDLTKPADHPGPETSGTAMFTRWSPWTMTSGVATGACVC